MFHNFTISGCREKIIQIRHFYITVVSYQLKYGVVFLSDSQKGGMKLLDCEIAPLLKQCEALQNPSNQGEPEFARMYFENQQGSQCALYEQIYDLVTEFVDSKCKYSSKLVEIRSYLCLRLKVQTLVRL